MWGQAAGANPSRPVPFTGSIQVTGNIACGGSGLARQRRARLERDLVLVYEASDNQTNRLRELYRLATNWISAAASDFPLLELSRSLQGRTRTRGKRLTSADSGLLL